MKLLLTSRTAPFFCILNIFFNKSKNLRYPQLQHFDFICGQIINENRILKFVVVAAVLSFFLSIGICIYAVAQPDSIPVLVTMNDFGETQYIGPVSRKNYQNFNVPEVAVQAQVKEFVNLMNTLSTDKAVMKKSVNKTYHLLTSITASKYSTLVREDNPFKDFGSRKKEVLFQTEPLKVSSDTYQVDYQIITRQLSGQLMSNTLRLGKEKVQIEKRVTKAKELQEEASE